MEEKRRDSWSVTINNLHDANNTYRQASGQCVETTPVRKEAPQILTYLPLFQTTPATINTCQ